MTTIKNGRGFSHESSVNQSVEWYTPPEIFDGLGLTFDLDPCSPGKGKSFVPARRVYTKADDGLTSDWGSGLVFVNPPYGRETQHWMRKLADHGNGIGLVFARTDVSWFQELAPRMDAISFVSGRVRFYRGNTTDRGDSPGAGSMLVAFGEQSADALLRSNLGITVRPQVPALSVVAAAA